MAYSVTCLMSTLCLIIRHKENNVRWLLCVMSVWVLIQLVIFDLTFVLFFYMFHNSPGQIKPHSKKRHDGGLQPIAHSSRVSHRIGRPLWAVPVPTALLLLCLCSGRLGSVHVVRGVHDERHHEAVKLRFVEVTFKSIRSHFIFSWIYSFNWMIVWTR